MFPRRSAALCKLQKEASQKPRVAPAQPPITVDTTAPNTDKLSLNTALSPGDKLHTPDRLLAEALSSVAAKSDGVSDEQLIRTMTKVMSLNTLTCEDVIEIRPGVPVLRGGIRDVASGRLFVCSQTSTEHLESGIRKRTFVLVGHCSATLLDEHPPTAPPQIQQKRAVLLHRSIAQQQAQEGAQPKDGAQQEGVQSQEGAQAQEGAQQEGAQSQEGAQQDGAQQEGAQESSVGEGA